MAVASSSSAAAAGNALSTSKWTSEQEKQFEKALASFESEDFSNKWDELAAMVPGKTAAEVKKHFELLIQDVKNIEAGSIVLPNYTARDVLVKEHIATDSKKMVPSSSMYSGQGHHHHHHTSANGTSANASNATNANNGSSKTKAQDQERRKGIPWTEDEHRLFLLGLEKFGKGDWRSISRNFVVSRTPTQVASHAQKYFIRLNSIHKDKRRTSIHDITSVNGDGRQQPGGPITGQPVGGGGASSSSAVGQPGTSAYSQPAVGTPVGAYSGRARPVPGTPMNVPHMAYPMPQPAMHH